MQTWGRPTIKLFAIGTLLLLLLASSGLQAEAAVNCVTVSVGMANCRDYLTKGTPVPVVGSPCCNGVRGLYNKFVSVAEKQAVCRCLNTLAGILKPNPDSVKKLPGLCKVNVVFSIGADCSRVH